MNKTTKDGFTQKQIEQLKALFNVVLEPIKSDIKELKQAVAQLQSFHKDEIDNQK